MKRIDYFWPQAVLKITSIVFFSQAFVEFICVRKVGYEWVFPLCAVLLAASVVWLLFLIVWNSIRAKGEKK